jgi:hypothetical protein
VVHAKDKEGNSVVMMVTPSSFMEMTDVKVANPTDKATPDAQNSQTGTINQTHPAAK